MRKKDQVKRISDCLNRLSELRVEARNSCSESRIKLKLESEVIAKELGAIRLLQGYKRISNNLVIAFLGAFGGGGVVVLIIQYLK